MIYVYIYIYIHVYMYSTYIYIYTYVLHIHIYIYIHIHIHTLYHNIIICIKRRRKRPTDARSRRGRVARPGYSAEGGAVDWGSIIIIVK